MRFIILSLLLVIGPQIAHAAQIGVAAGIRGEVIRASSVQRSAAIGQMSSGQTVYLGDEIKVGTASRLQVMLLDETIFTLGANAAMTIDEFVYDPAAPSSGTLSASVRQGAFRFVSGRVAAGSPDAMTVKTPSATIGVRGTSVAGDVEEDGSTTVILLGPGPNNSLGVAPGAISVQNDVGSIDITRPGFVTQVQSQTSQAPSPPEQASQEQIQDLEQSLSEQAVVEIAKELNVDVGELNLQTGEDTNNDGELDTFASNTVLATELESATSDGGTTQDRGLLAATALSLFGEDILEMEGEDLQDFFEGVNLGGAVADIFNQGAEYLGPTTLDDIRSAGLRGSVTFFANNVAFNGDCGAENCGSYNVQNVWDFSSQTVNSTLDGTFSIHNGVGDIAADGSNIIQGALSMQAEELSWAQASGPAFFEFSEFIPAANLQGFGPPGGAQGRIGEPQFDPETNEMLNRVPVDGFASVSQGALADNSILEVVATSSLSNVQFNGAGPSIANFSDHSVDIRVMPLDMPDGSENPVQPTEARGFIFGLETQQ